MTSRRLLKAAEAIREVVATAIVADIRDPRVKDVTVLGVKVAPDMREATVSVSVMGSESQKQLSLRGLQNSAGFLQSKIADRIDTRYIPKLQFELNRGAENAVVVSELLNKIKQEKSAQAGEEDASPDSVSDNEATDENSEGQLDPNDQESNVNLSPEQNDFANNFSAGTDLNAGTGDPNRSNADGAT